ncbi:phosphohydrolase [Leptospira perolatii]|uniref:Phosphohydrolase n=1 Tax=Leptospira perolatii TaxID=2023191 RepID=A0A2M9ZIJ2_9LEPT|nr:metallophosphoesterase [Leptospira perolatii]PJZ68546.1 phosphohydrolase [Leptospira perolatii]PJZ71876.1 phosphohydrolase [Leptospira perolatii]
MKLVHISDLHFPVRLPFFGLKGKMVPGYLNYSLRRRKKYPLELWQALIEDISSRKPDAVIISGDITNVSHYREYHDAFAFLRPLLGENTFMIPGNHDRYTKRAVAGAEPFYEKFFSRWMGEQVPNTKGYLKWKKIGSMMFIGWDSNQPMSILNAYGYVSPEIVQNTIEFLDQKKVKEYILVCHHPIWNPEHQQESYSHRLRNRDEIAKLLLARPPLAYLHGHVHSNWIKFPDPTHPYFVVNSASSTRLPDSHHDSGYHYAELKSKGLEFHRIVYFPNESKFQEAKAISYS